MKLASTRCCPSGNRPGVEQAVLHPVHRKSLLAVDRAHHGVRSTSLDQPHQNRQYSTPLFDHHVERITLSEKGIVGFANEEGLDHMYAPIRQLLPPNQWLI
ncbi:hypothetical protein WDL1CHR_02450 [Variovorax sp. WDL1]|nr:hypothetical protein CHC06_04883 [Variovorax sp. B2]VTV11584.1 hypothetical protein WDL1CHR_02450 [Variovorax sp. WDL1]